MARLHDIDGVTRVSLSNSGAEKVESQGDVAGTERDVRNAAPCGYGKRPAFEVVMFFEKDAAAVATTPTTATGSVSATPTPAADAVGDAERRRHQHFRLHHDHAAPGRGHPVSRTFRILIVAVVALGAVGGYWKLVLAPKRAQVAELDQQVATQQAQLVPDAEPDRHLPGREGRVQGQLRHGRASRQGRADRRRHALARGPARRGRQAQRRRLRRDQHQRRRLGRGASVAPGAINAGAFSAMPFSFSFSGDFGTLGSFFSRLERFVSLKGDKIVVSGRLMRVESITLTPGEGGWPALTAQVGASSYIVPEAHGRRRERPGSGRRDRVRRRPAPAPRPLPRPARARRRSPMNVITDTLRGLVQRKLWPVALLLVAALVAVPLLLAKEPEAADRRRAARREAGGPARDLRVRRRRRRGHQRAPPRARRREGPVRAGRAVEGDQGQAQEGRRAKADARTPRASPPPRAPATLPRRGGAAPASEPPASEAPAPKKTYPLYSIKVRFGKTDGELKTETVERLTVLPSAEEPVLVYRGVEEGGKVAVFELTGSVVAQGDGECDPTPGGLPDPQAARRRDRVHHRVRHGHRDRRPVPAGAREDLHEDDDVARSWPRPRRRSCPRRA